jgi:hypothetical protein
MRIGELSSAREADLHTGLTQKEGAHDTAIAGAIAIPHDRRRGVDALLDIREQSPNQLSGVTGDPLHVGGI